jgi:hypothetical protein
LLLIHLRLLLVFFFLLLGPVVVVRALVRVVVIRQHDGVGARYCAWNLLRRFIFQFHGGDDSEHGNQGNTGEARGAYCIDPLR